MTDKAERKESSGQVDFVLIILILSLLLFGFIMLFSASAPEAARNGILSTVLKQGLFLVGGIATFVVAANFDHHRYKLLQRPMIFIAIAVMYIVPVWGFASHGATRQISVGSISFQPSEFAKIVLVLFFAGRFSNKKTQNLTTDYKNIGICFGVMLAFCAACFLQSHMSAAIVLALISILMMLIAGLSLPWKWTLTGGGAIAAIGAYFVLTEEYRLNRFLALFDPFAYKQGIGWQIVQSLYAVGSGGLFGLGLGQSRQKFNYLPEAQNDYIFAVVCEELGFIGGLAVLILFVLLVWRGICVALNARDKFGMYTAFGITSIIAMQVLINIGVVLSILPSTGMQLPFFSSGGSSMIATMWGMGILVNISKNSKIKKI
ncbi:MAG: cell division protein FtsW [Ruminococcaceae bacterium]|nr:cell division protein FtsW [Oscillospiraceae bacterium]